MAAVYEATKIEFVGDNCQLILFDGFKELLWIDSRRESAPFHKPPASNLGIQFDVVSDVLLYAWTNFEQSARRTNPLNESYDWKDYWRISMAERMKDQMENAFRI